MHRVRQLQTEVAVDALRRIRAHQHPLITATGKEIVNRNVEIEGGIEDNRKPLQSHLHIPLMSQVLLKPLNIRLNNQEVTINTGLLPSIRTCHPAFYFNPRTLLPLIFSPNPKDNPNPQLKAVAHAVDSLSQQYPSNLSIQIIYLTQHEYMQTPKRDITLMSLHQIIIVSLRLRIIIKSLAMTSLLRMMQLTITWSHRRRCFAPMRLLMLWDWMD